MTYPGGGGLFDGPLGDILGGASSRPSGPKKEEKGVAWEAKVIDGKYYVPLSQVADLLKANGVLPKVTEGIKRRVEKGPPKPSRDAGSEQMNDR
jgi:hypothetical protein